MQDNAAITLSARRINFVVWIILICYPLVGMGVDLIAPSLPAISSGLQVSTAFSKNLVSIYLLGYAIGNFFIGLLSDSWGRKKLLIVNMLGFTLLSMVPVFFENSWILLGVRLLQGTTIGAFAVLSRGILSDILPSERLMRTSPILATMWGVGPILGPLIGGYLQFYFGWQSCFSFFAIFGFIGLVAFMVIIPETHFRRLPLNLKQIGANFKEIVCHKVFMGSIVIMGCVYSLLIVFNTLAPFLIQERLGYSPVFFGHVALWMGLLFLTGTILCRRLIKKHPPEKIFYKMLPITIIWALIAVVLAYFWGDNLFVIIVPSLLMFFATGIFYPAGMGKGLSLFRHLAGSASAMMNLVNVLIVSSTSALMSLISANSMFPIAGANLLLILLAALSYWFLIHPRKS